MNASKPKRHIRFSDGTFYGAVWCGIDTSEAVLKGDTFINEDKFLYSLRIQTGSSYCSCCDNAIMRSIRQRTLGT